ncbi:hypothetical protein CI109_106911 [Kwoniella shandongensis]|uniref:Uncharacterized protein n=1 Tax=Kwoniella shandongensis TaxID=1734106 RepID=A0A5M6C694_9TREE|nr:uncharacterized protein CI109_000834 [Kwoniella shandongensis]KAA5530654.1 hypothetical protein CI109_000834 [Kwoniella shandongensis]
MSKVQLYVYDLSHGMAKSMSLMLTGKQIDGIWHTAVVAYGREIFYGQGILESVPGRTHHGPPLHIIDVGETHIDEPTLDEYLQSLGEMYTPTKYHLIEFNCNHFSADVVGFLTGQEIPSWISGLPAEFLSTPFGQAMKPQIDAMFRRTDPSARPIPGPGPTGLPTPPASGAATPSLASTLLNSVAAQATAHAQSSTTTSAIGAGGAPTPPNAETSPLIAVSSSAHFQSILAQHPAVIVNFTNTPSCPPCRVIKPVYETISATHASTYGAKGARFVEIELGIGEGREIASKYNVHATPTFLFFVDGKRADEIKGAAKRELEVKVETFLEDCFPTHPHRKVYLPAIGSLPRQPITASVVPAYPALISKLEGFLVGKGKEEDLRVIKEQVVPYLEGKKSLGNAELQTLVERWIGATHSLLESLKAQESFPVIDLWRVGLLKAPIASLLALRLSPTAQPTTIPNPVSTIFALATNTLTESSTATPKPFLITVLRFATNLLASHELANLILAQDGHNEIQESLVSLLVESLLHPDVGVRTAAGGVGLNMGIWRQGSSGGEDGKAVVDWEVEMVSALVEGIDRETDEDVAHRLLAALGLVIYLSPGYEDNVKPLLEVLGAKETIEKKARGWKKKEVKKLGDEIASKMC